MKAGFINVFIALILSAPSHVFAAKVEAKTDDIPNERAVRRACSDEALSEVDISECLEKAAATSEKTLKQAEYYALATLSGWDEDKEYIDLAKTRLITAGKTFAQFRADQCSFAASMGGGAIGAALEMRRNACIAELNLRRAKQLRDFMDTLP
jgi:uncharacterized protein YecT (DUF1311 family)